MATKKAKRSKKAPAKGRAKAKSRNAKPPKTKAAKAPPKKKAKRKRGTSSKAADENVDPEQAKRMGLLQIRIGRASHFYGMAASISLAVSGVILLLTQAGRPLEELPRDLKLLLPWLIPLLVGAGLAAAALVVKWVPYKGARRSGHFLMTLLAFLVSMGTLMRVLRQAPGGLDTQSLTWLYPASFSGISLTLISMAMTWRGMGRRKLLSILAAALPMAILVYGFTPLFSSGIPSDLLILTFMGSAVAVQFSGSMLHIIASSTSVQAKEVIRVSNDRLQILHHDLKDRAGALDYKEEALRSREADVEAQDQAVTSRLQTLQEREKDLKERETVLEKGRKAMRQEEEEVRAQAADLAAREKTLNLKEEDVRTKEKELREASQDLGRRKGAATRTEKRLEKLEADLEAHKEKLAERQEEVKAAEKAVEDARGEVEKVQEALMKKEADLEVREEALELRGGAPLPEGASEAVQELQKLKVTLLAKQKELSQREVDLKSREERFKGAAQKADAWRRKADNRLKEIQDMERAVGAREEALAEREAAVEARSSELQSQLDLLESSVKNVKQKEERYEHLYKEAHSQASAATEAEKDLKARQSSLAKREAKLEEVAKRLVEERDTLTGQHQEILRKQKDLEAQASAVKLRQLEMERARQAGKDGTSGVQDEREKALRLWEDRLKEKEREMKARLYEKEKQLREWEDNLQEGVVEVEEAEVQTEADRIKSGTPRLDDLLMGGIPLESQVLFVGPAFVGKEIGILNFVAQGLKEGVPCILVTTSRPPEEIAKELGPILPSFKEYEQLDLVRWIDASTPQPNSKRKSPEKKGNRYVVKGADDYEGILEALKAAEKELRGDHPHLRLAFMTLSTSVAQGKEREALSFVQRLVNRMRRADIVSLYAVERGMHSDQQVESLEHQMDGAIHFKVDRKKNLLAVAGVCDVQTRDWVEYKFTNRALMIGAFMLERIR